MYAVELEHTSGDETAESVTDLLSNVESAKSLAQLVFGIPSAEQVDRAGKEDSLNDTKDDSDTEERLVRLDCGGCGADGPPDDGSAADVEARSSDP